MRADRGEAASWSIGGGDWMGLGAFAGGSVGESEVRFACSPSLLDDCVSFESAVLSSSPPFVDDCS